MTGQTSCLEPLSNYFGTHEEEILKDFFTFLSFPSISTDPEYTPAVRECCNWVSDYMKAMGLSVECWETKGHPVIFAEHLEAGPDKPTLLIYNHYDVQPVDPLEEWESAPFEPTIRNGQVYARGAQDNKGQFYYSLIAVKGLLAKHEGKLPINIKWVVEGEEEVGSTHLPETLIKYRDRLKSDYAVIVDVGLRDPNQPAVTLGVRGMVTMDFEVQGSKIDLHSGSHGGLAYNPNRAVVEMLAKLRDHTGKVAVPGFYDGVEEMSDEERSLYNFDFDAKKYEETFGAPPSGGEPGYTAIESNLLRPTLEINGIFGGYAGAGFKTVIPAKAGAKISCRLVPGQNPLTVANRIKDYLEGIAPEGIKAKVTIHPGTGAAVRANPNSDAVKSFAQAYTEVCGASCQYILEGASIPVTPDLAEAADADCLLVGYGLGTDQIHAPNEHFGVDRLRKGFMTVARAIEILGS